MATLNLGRIKPVFRGAYAGGTAYVVDDIVTSGNETFICILASTGNATSNATYWTKLAAKGTDGTDVGTTLTTQGDILYRDGSGLQRLAKGTASQTLKMNSGATAPEWATVTTPTSDYVKINTTTFDGSTAAFNEDHFSATYDNYRVFVTGMKMASSVGASMYFRVRNSSGEYASSEYFVSGGGWYRQSGTSNEHNAGQWGVTQPDMNGWNIPDTGTGSGDRTYDMVLDFFDVNSTTNTKNVHFTYFGWERGGTYTTYSMGGININTTTALTGWKFYNTQGANFANTGKIITYGLKS